MRFASEIVLAPDETAEIVAAAESVRATLETPPDIALVFASHHLASWADEFAPAVYKTLAPRTMLGACAQGVIADDKEIERAPAVSIWAGTVDGLDMSAGHVEIVDPVGGMPETIDDVEFTGVPAIPDDTAALVVIADPFTFPADAFLARMNRDYEGLPCLGGLAAGRGPGDGRLFLDDAVFDSGALVAVARGPLQVETLVSQGCRPVGDPYIVTKSDGSLVYELGGRPAIDRLRELIESLDEADTALAQQGLHVGRVIDESKTDFAPGDFLIRSLTGIDQDAGAIRVGDAVDVGATLQFHVRDAASADADLEMMLGGIDTDPAAAIVFTCNGRGRHLFEAPDHDAGAIRSRYPETPIAGFFCAGEIGPIGGRNFLHGFTASVGLISASAEREQR